MTALVLHETDGLQKILYPRVYFDPYAKWKSAPARRGENAILQAVDFIGKHEITALVLHENDGLQKILFLRVYFDTYPARKRVCWGKCVLGRLDIGGLRLIKQKIRRASNIH